LALLAHKDFWIILLSNLLIGSIPNEDYYSHASCALNYISTFLFDNYREWHVRSHMLIKLSEHLSLQRVICVAHLQCSVFVHIDYCLSMFCYLLVTCLSFYVDFYKFSSRFYFYFAVFVCHHLGKLATIQLALLWSDWLNIQQYCFWYFAFIIKQF
jgi:hypothetical protein